MHSSPQNNVKQPGEGKYCPKETTYIQYKQREGFYMTIINLQGINITPPYLQHNREPLSTFDPRPNVVCTLHLMQ